MAPIPFLKLTPFNEPNLKPVNGIVQPPVMPPLPSKCRRTNVLDSLRKILLKIGKMKWAYHFQKPVDSNQHGHTNYHEVIKHPMDLGTIKQRLNNRYYRQSDEAIADFKLVYENCIKFHDEDCEIYMAGQYLKHFFNICLDKIDLKKEMVVRRKSRKQQPRRADRPKVKPKAALGTMKVNSNRPSGCFDRIFKKYGMTSPTRHPMHINPYLS